MRLITYLIAIRFIVTPTALTLMFTVGIAVGGGAQKRTQLAVKYDTKNSWVKTVFDVI